jgi:hypothetical protein
MAGRRLSGRLDRCASPSFEARCARTSG